MMKPFRNFYTNGEKNWKFKCADCGEMVIAYFEDNRMEYVCPDCGAKRRYKQGMQDAFNIMKRKKNKELSNLLKAKKTSWSKYGMHPIMFNGSIDWASDDIKWIKEMAEVIETMGKIKVVCPHCKKVPMVCFDFGAYFFICMNSKCKSNWESKSFDTFQRHPDTITQAELTERNKMVQRP